MSPLDIKHDKIIERHNNHNSNGGNRKPAPKARFGGTRQDGNGEWWVFVLAEGRWVRSKELGLRGPEGL